LSEGQVLVVAECTISPGKVDVFRELARETIDAVKAESKVDAYRWYFNKEETKCYIVEQHPNSGSLIRHLAVVGPYLLKILDVAKMTRFEIYGSLGPLEFAENLQEKIVKGFNITKLDWNPQNYQYWNGFVR
jgi:quinol monooxygenase YgiN